MKGETMLKIEQFRKITIMADPCQINMVDVSVRDTEKEEQDMYIDITVNVPKSIKNFDDIEKFVIDQVRSIDLSHV
jgi:hypothetical protein